MKDQAEVADFDVYVNSLINPRKPGELQWLMSVYPDFVQRRIEQVHQDYEFALRNQMIDMWGINTKDDLMFKSLVDQKKVDGPRLGRHVALSDTYASGALSPFVGNFNGDSKKEAELYAPFSSARVGAKPNADGWKFSNATNPFSAGRTTADMARSMYTLVPRIKQGTGAKRSAQGRGRRKLSIHEPKVKSTFSKSVCKRECRSSRLTEFAVCWCRWGSGPRRRVHSRWVVSWESLCTRSGCQRSRSQTWAICVRSRRYRRTLARRTYIF